MGISKYASGKFKFCNNHAVVLKTGKPKLQLCGTQTPPYPITIDAFSIIPKCIGRQLEARLYRTKAEESWLAHTGTLLFSSLFGAGVVPSRTASTAPDF